MGRPSRNLSGNPTGFRISQQRIAGTIRIFIFRHILPMEALMNRGSYPYKLTAEDHLLIKKWKGGVGAVYAAVLLVLVLMVAAATYTRTEVAMSGGGPALSPAEMATSSVV